MTHLHVPVSGTGPGAEQASVFMELIKAYADAVGSGRRLGLPSLGIHTKDIGNSEGADLAWQSHIHSGKEGRIDSFLLLPIHPSFICPSIHPSVHRFI